MIGEPGVPHAFGECTSYMFSSFSLSDIPGADEEFRSRARDLAASAVANMPMDRRARSWMGFDAEFRSEEHTSELQSLMRISYAVFCLKKKKYNMKNKQK